MPVAVENMTVENMTVENMVVENMVGLIAPQKWSQNVYIAPGVWLQ